ncbi:hypothetical protein D3C71_1672700 [compost metagenome]
MFIDFARAVAIQVAQPHQFGGRCVRAQARLPGTIEAAVQELRLNRGQGLAGQRPAVEDFAGFLLAWHAADHGGEGRAGGIEHQAYR